MERLTVDGTGGEVWLGFARQRVKVLRKSGVKYARQIFDMPDGSRVVIELAGKDHTIRLSGGGVEVISGVVRKGDLIEIPAPDGSPAGTKPKKVLRSFKATAHTAEKVLKRPDAATGFKDIKELATPILPQLGISSSGGGVGESQISILSAGRFSGRMKEIMQVLLGAKEQKQLSYVSYWYDTYGVYTKDSKYWLIRISKQYGVLAMPLKFKKTKGSKNFTEAGKKFISEYGGLPTGEGFPLDIDKAVTSGTVLRLMPPYGLNKFYDKEAYYTPCSWSFNREGSKAHNTCHGIEGGSRYSFHYKITISISQAGDGEYSGSAELIEVEKHKLYKVISYKYWPDIGPEVVSIPFRTPVSYDFSWMLSNLTGVGIIKARDKGTTAVPLKQIDLIPIVVGHNDDDVLFRAGYAIDGYISMTYTDGTEDRQMVPRPWVDIIPFEPNYPYVTGGDENRQVSSTHFRAVPMLKKTGGWYVDGQGYTGGGWGLWDPGTLVNIWRHPHSDGVWGVQQVDVIQQQVRYDFTHHGFETRKITLFCLEEERDQFVLADLYNKNVQNVARRYMTWGWGDVVETLKVTPSPITNGYPAVFLEPGLSPEAPNGDFWWASEYSPGREEAKAEAQAKSEEASGPPPEYVVIYKEPPKDRVFTAYKLLNEMPLPPIFEPAGTDLAVEKCFTYINHVGGGHALVFTTNNGYRKQAKTGSLLEDVKSEDMAGFYPPHHSFAGFVD